MTQAERHESVHILKEDLILNRCPQSFSQKETKCIPQLQRRAQRRIKLTLIT